MPADEATQRDLAAAQESEEQEQNCLFIGERGLGFGPSALTSRAFSTVSLLVA